MINTLYEPFRHWSDGGSVWIISDTHFADPDCRIMDPKWPSEGEMVKAINKSVKKNDTLIHLGDVGNPEYISQIKAHHKVLILGNHDARGRYTAVFDEIYTGPLMISPKILLSHEPIPLPFVFNIHGHDHSKCICFPEGCEHMNLAANVCGYKPVSLGDIIKEGYLANTPTIHRLAIDEQVSHSSKERYYGGR